MIAGLLYQGSKALVPVLSRHTSWNPMTEARGWVGTDFGMPFTGRSRAVSGESAPKQPILAQVILRVRWEVLISAIRA